MRNILTGFLEKWSDAIFDMLHFKFWLKLTFLHELNRDYIAKFTLMRMRYFVDYFARNEKKARAQYSCCDFDKIKG